MIDTPERIRLPAVTDDKIEILCNWREGIKGEYLKLRFNGQEAIIPRSALSKVAILLASEEEQDAMIPTKSISVRSLRKVVTIQLQRDMKVGEYLQIPVEFKIPLNQDSTISILN